MTLWMAHSILQAYEIVLMVEALFCGHRMAKLVKGLRFTASYILLEGCHPLSFW